MASPEAKGFVPFTSLLNLRNSILLKKHSEEHQEKDLKPNTDLEVGRELPIVYENLPPGIRSEPLADVDPNCSNQNTSMALNKRSIFRP